ncbi:hypothetical protein WMY93_010176 [Mugilogobius chulae]|uniref:Uncharacterized protein n=1 Tax=Mugilogobius chulae TaxID=88201 RepID=A0AAW0P6F6_9GOBI
MESMIRLKNEELLQSVQGRRRRRKGGRWHEDGRKLEVPVVPDHEARPALVPTPQSHAQRGHRQWKSVPALELHQSDAQVTLLQQPKDSDTLFDCVFEPIYWFVDNVTRWFGVVFVSLVIVLTSSVVIIVYMFVIP